jgi:hypothetical protein
VRDPCWQQPLGDSEIIAPRDRRKSALNARDCIEYAERLLVGWLECRRALSSLAGDLLAAFDHDFDTRCTEVEPRGKPEIRFWEARAE